MRKKYYRRKKQGIFSKLISESIDMFSMAPPWLCILMGSLLFILFYLFVPYYFEYKFNDPAQGVNGFSSLIVRFARLSQWAGAAIGIASLFFAIRNHYFGRKTSKKGKQNTGFFAKFLASFFD